MGANHGDGAGGLIALATFGALPGIAPAAAAIGAPAYMAVRGAQDQAKAAGEAQKKMVDQSNQALADADKRRKDQESAATASAARDQARRSVLAGSSGPSNQSGYGSTILSSPLGSIGSPPANGSGGGKTLLGT